MDQFKRDFIDILEAAFIQTSKCVNTDIDFEKAVKVANEHNITPILYYGAVNSNIPQDWDSMQLLQKRTLRCAMVSMRQMLEIERITKEFEKESVEYMLLKGTILKAIYPKPEMRTMGDADILIKQDQYSKIQTIMERLQYTFKYESNHELVWVKPTLFLELHKRIMTTYNKVFYEYFDSGWKLAHRVSGSCAYEMSVEDFYIFTFVHFTKHYRISGIGIKHVIDLWVYSNTHPEMNWEYVENELNKMHLLEFHANIKQTIAVWFENAAENDITELITNVVFNSGQYGTAEMTIINRALRDGENSALKAKVNSLLGNIFPAYEFMSSKYPILKKVPILLPVMWIFRVITTVIFRNNLVRKYLASVEKMDRVKIRENEKALRFVGLSFDGDGKK